jgi:bacterial leucyl aminopeptidase
MRTAVAFTALLASVASARFFEPGERDLTVGAAEKYLIELAPGDTRWVTEDEKWELRRVWSLPIIQSYIGVRH